MISGSSARIRSGALLAKVTDAESACRFINDGMTVAMSGFTAVGYPKAVPKALAARVREMREDMTIFLLTGASVGDEIDGELSRLGIIGRRSPYQTNRDLRRKINDGDCEFFDVHLGEIDAQVRRGFLGHIDIAVIEVAMVMANGAVVPTTSVGNSPTALCTADRIIIEVNSTIPESVLGFHDIFMPGDPPGRQIIPLAVVDQRIGSPYMEVDLEKVCAVVVSAESDSPRPLSEQDDCSRAISAHLIDFLHAEVGAGRLPERLLPLQSGVGNIANSVLKGFLDSSFSGLTMYSEVLQDGALDLIDAGKMIAASATALTLSPSRMVEILRDIDRYRGRVILRPQEITNSAEVIGRLGVIAINAAVEVDLYGNVNSSHILGKNIVSGLGGSGDFARNAYLSVFCVPSVRNAGAISGVVPLVSHIDHTEHDVDVLITENGVADLRGLAPRERARRVIERCAHPSFRPALEEYLDRSCALGGHCPIDLKQAFNWHVSLAETKTMMRR